MNSIDKLKSANGISGFAPLVGFTPKGLAYLLYKTDISTRYRSFEIPKKSGGVRKISAPNPKLALVQRNLANLLVNCADDFSDRSSGFLRAAHGFIRARSIMSNAEIHKRRRFVFNVDIEDFFGSINFGRVRGFFMKDQSFELPADIATIIAQIACHENQLPQGSPSSPVISNFIGNLVDARLTALSRSGRCSYTRYADDLTFSTNEQHFPKEIAENTYGADWRIGKKLQSEVQRAGFRLNHRKTRMSLRQSQQSVTGLVVNEKINIDQKYYRQVRAMCDSAFKRGWYHDKSPKEIVTVTTGNDLNKIEGRLSFIYGVKTRSDRSNRTNKLATDKGEMNVPLAPINLYKKFIFFRRFIVPGAPLIVTEGSSDITYLRCAIKKQAASFPSLASFIDGEPKLDIDFLPTSQRMEDMLKLGNGTGGQAKLIGMYSKMVRKFKHRPLAQPVIILCDNDDGANAVLKAASKAKGVTVSTKTKDPYYYLGENLYLVKVPEGAAPTSSIEDLFPDRWLNVKLDGKSFDRDKEHADDTAYGKTVFAEGVVRPNRNDIDFANFDALLARISDCIQDYASVRARLLPTVVANSTS
ncbi:retron Ec67 family RNA-directed DNA polymerase/endonuclease [Pyruvatibacter sp.]|uniref:retron Ec67 family RNA-directed DNA polymerase/endonuclease n=1 Tax=Pyruvatibacter sp. TaxID=1981328 RepID=UPI00326639BA